MTTRDFIARQYRNNDGKAKWCSSVVKDGKGNIFSYGAHYPLLFNFEGFDFINTRGYSVTTAKHINWAFSAVNHNAISINLPEGFNIDAPDNNLERLKEILADEAADLTVQMAKKRRKNTQVYSQLEYRLRNIEADLKAIHD